MVSENLRDIPLPFRLAFFYNYYLLPSKYCPTGIYSSSHTRERAKALCQRQQIDGRTTAGQCADGDNCKGRCERDTRGGEEESKGATEASSCRDKRGGEEESQAAKPHWTGAGGWPAKQLLRHLGKGGDGELHTQHTHTTHTHNTHNTHTTHTPHTHTTHTPHTIYTYYVHTYIYLHS